MKPLHRLLAPLAALTLTAVLAACSSSPDAPDEDIVTETSVAEAPGSEEQPPQTPVEEVTVEEPCPYLDADFVSDTVGQRVGKVLVTTSTPPVGPLPKCEFQRWDAEASAIIDTRTIEEGAGLEKALELVPGGNPANAGEGGSVLVQQGQARTDLAAFSGTTMVIITINQESSLEANELAKAVFAAIG